MNKSAILIALLVSSTLHAAITGTVVSADLKPIAAATIRAYAAEDSAAMRARVLAGKLDRESVASVQSAEDGTFSVDVKGTTAVDLRIEAAGHNHSYVATIDGDDVGPIILGAPPTRMLHVTSGGKAVANAIVVSGLEIARTNAAGEVAVPMNGAIFAVHPDFAISRKEGSGLEISLSRGVALRGRVVNGAGPVPHAIVSINGWPLAESADDGTFAIAHAPQNWQSVSAARGNDVGTAVRSKAAAIEVRLTPGSTFTGTLLYTKRNVPVAGARMTLATSDTTSLIAVSDAKGNFSFGPLLARGYSISGMHPAYAIESSSVAIPAVRTRAIAAQPFARARGRVIDEERKPIASAMLIATGNSSNVHTALTNAAGEFSLRIMPVPTIALPIYAARRDYVSGASEPRTWQPGEVRDNIVITLAHGFVAQVRVVDKQRQPVPNVQVNVSRSPDEATQRLMPVACADPSSPDCHRTDAEGLVSIRTSEGNHDVMVFADDIAPVRLMKQMLSGRSKTIVVNVDRGIEISGRVVLADGTPVADAFVETPVLIMRRSATSAADGTFRIAGLAAGATAVTAYSSDHRLASESVTVNAPAKDVKLTLPRGAHIEGRVFDRVTQQPVTDFTVLIPPRSGRGIAVEDQPTHADDGRYAIDNVPPGVVEVVAHAAGYVPASRRDITVEDGKSVTGVDIPLDRGATISGRVTSAGAAVAGVQVRDASRMSQPAGNGTTDADGLYTLDGVPAGDHTIEFQKAGFIVLRKPIESAAGKEAHLDAELDRGNELTGRVLDGSGRPVAGANVSVNSADRRPGNSNATTDGDGTFDLQGLADGKYTVVARKNGYVSGETSDVDPRQTHSVTLTLTSGATITGHVVGLPADQLSQVMVSASGGMSHNQTNADAGGNFTLTGMPDGRVRVDAILMSAANRRTAPPKTITVDNGVAPAVEINFDEGITVRGRVTRSGVALPGGAISFLPQMIRGTGGMAATARQPVNTFLSPDGTYIASGLMAGDYDVRINGPAITYQTTYTAAASGTFDIDIRGALLRGRVVDSASGAPLAEARIEAGRRTGGGATAMSDSDGRFAIDALADDTYDLQVTREQYSPARQQVVVSNGAAAEVEVRLEQAPAVIIRLVDATGAPVDANVMITDTSRKSVGQPQRVDAGSFKAWLKPGSYNANAFGRGFVNKSVPFTTPPNEVRVTILRAGALVIRAKSAQVLRLDQQDGTMRRPLPPIHEGINGPFESIAPGSYLLSTIAADRTVLRSVPVLIAAGETVTIDVP
jgi:protocatechuate 3,4-dioxygenase beta subunit